MCVLTILALIYEVSPVDCSYVSTDHILYCNGTSSLSWTTYRLQENKNTLHTKRVYDHKLDDRTMSLWALFFQCCAIKQIRLRKELNLWMCFFVAEGYCLWSLILNYEANWGCSATDFSHGKQFFPGDRLWLYSLFCLPSARPGHYKTAPSLSLPVLVGKEYAHACWPCLFFINSGLIWAGLLCVCGPMRGTIFHGNWWRPVPLLVKEHSSMLCWLPSGSCTGV